jgi:hypothetical protein
MTRLVSGSNLGLSKNCVMGMTCHIEPAKIAAAGTMPGR